MDQALQIVMIPGALLFVAGTIVSYRIWRQDRAAKHTHHPAE
jgi:hypothetical protein